MRTVARSASGRGPWLAALDEADDRDLMSLFASRPDLALGGAANLADVAERMVSPGSVDAFYDRADQACRQVLEALCVLAPGATTEALAAALGASSEVLAPLIDRLGTNGMLLHNSRSITVNPGLAAVIPHPCRLGPPAARLLANRTVQELAAIGSRLGVATKGAKPTLIDAILEALGDTDRLTTLLAHAPAGTDDLVGRTANEWPIVELSFGAAQTARNERSAPGWCLTRGLLLATGWATAVMPREVGVALRGGRLFGGFSPQPPELVTTQLDAGAERRAADAALGVVADMAALCDAWSAVPAKVLQAGGLGIREVRRVAKLLGRPDDETARLVELAGWAGLVDIDGDVAVPTVDYDRWLELSSAGRWRALVSVWLSLPLHLSVAGATGQGDKAIAPLLDRAPEPNAVSRRALVIMGLTEAGPATACDPQSLAERAEWRSPALWGGGPARPPLLISWLLAEAQLLGMAAGGALSTFGALLAEGDPTAAEGALAALAPPVVSEVILQADLTAMVAGEAPPGLRAELDLLADVESSGNATVWRFSDTTLRRGFDAGRTSEQILAVLRDHAPRGVPQPLAYLIEDLGRRFGKVRIGPAGCYVRSEDPSLLAEVVRARRTAGLGLRLLAPTVAVSDVAPDAVLSTLRDGGYLPAGEQPDGTVIITRPAARRAPAPSSRSGAGLDDDFDDDDFDDDDFDDDDFDDEVLAELMGRPDLLAALTGLPPSVATSLLEATGNDGAGLPQSDDELFDVVQRLRNGPAQVPTSPATPVTRPGPVPRPSPPPLPPHLVDGAGRRPTHIARDSVAVTKMANQARAEGWPVRMSYVNAQGEESEFFAEITNSGRGALRVRYLSGRRGGSDLALYRVQWVRVLTEAEEEMQLP